MRSRESSQTAPLIVFAKTPLAGQVKTRLQPNCTPSQSAEIAMIFIRETLSNAIDVWDGQIILATWPTCDHPAIRALLAEFSIECVLQCEGDLGAKMHHALDCFGYPAAILGSDVPHMTSQNLQNAQRLLSQGKNVLGPSLDGGYYLIGLQQSHKDVFVNMPWSSDQVLKRTLAMTQGGSDFILLDEINDIDTWDDLQQNASQIGTLQRYLTKSGLQID